MFNELWDAVCNSFSPVQQNKAAAPHRLPLTSCAFTCSAARFRGIHTRPQLCGDAQQWDSSSVVFIFFFFFFPLIFSCKDGFQSDRYPLSHVLIILLLQPHCFLLHPEAVALPLCPTPSQAPGTNALLPLLWRSFQNWNEKDLEAIYKLISKGTRASLEGYGDMKLSVSLSLVIRAFSYLISILPWFHLASFSAF